MNLTALPTRFTRIWRRPKWIADEGGGDSRVDIDEELECFLICANREGPQGFVDDIGKNEGDRLEAQPSRFDLGEVEDVVENLEQRSRRGPHSLEVVTLL